MQATPQRLSPVLMQLQVELPAEVVKSQLDKSYANFARKARVKGFRPGKAPRSVLAQLFGGQIANDVANALVQESLPKALSEHKLSPINEPSVEAGKLEPEAAFSYTAKFEVQPEIEDVVHEGFELSRPSRDVTDAMLSARLEEIRKAHATLRAIEPARPAKTGDHITMDFTISLGGKEIKDAGGKAMSLELGSGNVLPEIEAALIGKSVGDHATAEVHLPETHPRKEFRGKHAKFAIELTDIKEHVSPELDDEFAKDVGDFATLADLKADIQKTILKELERKAEFAIAEQIVDRLNEKNPLEVPPSLVDQQLKVIIQEFLQKARLQNAQMSPEQWGTLGQQFKVDAEKKVRAGFLMAAVAKKNGFQVSNDDIERAFGEIAEDTGKNIAKVKAEYRDAQKRQLLVAMVLEEKILDHIESKSVVRDEPAAAASKAT